MSCSPCSTTCASTTSTSSPWASTCGRRQSTPRCSASTVPRSSRPCASRPSRWVSATSNRAPPPARPTTPVNRSLPRIRRCWLGRVPYRQAWDLQRSLVEQVRAGEAPDTLLLLEHPHLYTMGPKGTAAHLLWDGAERERREVDLVWSDRGGDATYHGPGQLVGYPILDLARHRPALLVHLRSPE